MMGNKLAKAIKPNPSSRGLRPGTLLAVVDVAEAPSDHVRTWLADTLDLSPTNGVRAVLPQLFTPLATTSIRQSPGWTSFTFLGRR